MNIVWINSSNFGYPMGKTGQLQPEAIVYHIAQGSLSAIDGWFCNPASEASSHFAVGLNGAIHQYVHLTDASWANGGVQNPDLSIPWLAECVQQDTVPNLCTITIEHEGYSGVPWPEAQYQSSLALTRWLLEGQGLQHWLDGNLDHRFIGHCRIDSVDRANCPGTGWPQDRLFADLKEDNMGMTTQEKEAFRVLQADVAKLLRLKNPCNFGDDHKTMGDRMGEYRTAIDGLQKHVLALEGLKNLISWGDEKKTAGEWFTEWRIAIAALQEGQAAGDLKDGDMVDIAGRIELKRT